jgi:hypothetical protein
VIPEFFPREQYYCVLDEQPDFLVPAEALEPYRNPNTGPLIVNPRCWMGWQGNLPPSFGPSTAHDEQLYRNPWMIWVDDPDRATVWPYWLGREWAHLLQHLAPGRGYDGGLPDDNVDVLRIADILTTGDLPECRRRAWWDAVAAAASQLVTSGVLALQHLLPPFHISALRRYYRYHTRVGSFALGDDQTAGRYVAYDEPLTRYVHDQLTRTVSDLVGRAVVPSYNYLAFYQGGAVLDPHTDREACEYTISLCIDATPDPRTHGGWPLWVQTEAGPVSLVQGIGDAVLFRGRYLSHWRDRLPDGYTSSSVLFHFVDAVP